MPRPSRGLEAQRCGAAAAAALASWAWPGPERPREHLWPGQARGVQLGLRSSWARRNSQDPAGASAAVGHLCCSRSLQCGLSADVSAWSSGHRPAWFSALLAPGRTAVVPLAGGRKDFWGEPLLPRMTCGWGRDAVEAGVKSRPALLSVKSAEAGQIEQNHFHSSLVHFG